MNPKEDPLLGDILFKLISKERIKNVQALKQEYGNELKNIKQGDLLIKLKKQRVAKEN